MNANGITAKSEEATLMNTHQQALPTGRAARVLNVFARILGALVMFGMFLFCSFGFLASFEPGNGMIWQIGYGALACGSLVGAVALFPGVVATGVN